METRFLVSRSAFLALILVLSIGATKLGHASSTQDLRLYKVNKDGISSRFWFTRGKAKLPGCHNLKKKTRLHSAVQFGYSACRIFTQKNCKAEAQLNFTRKDLDGPSGDLEQGYRWYVVADHPRGVRAKSWWCGEADSQANQR